jgi:hypothetical protein
MPATVSTRKLFAAGLGLMLHSPEPVRVLVKGRDYHPAGGDLQPPLTKLLKQQHVVFFGTGSPQLDYVLKIRRGPLPKSLAARAREKVRFGIDVVGGALCIRDGYDPMDWGARDQVVRRVAVPDGYYALTAYWEPTDADAEGRMLLHFTLERAKQRIRGDGWPFLPFRLRR